MPNKIRAFLAITIPLKVQKNVEALLKGFRQKAPEVNWFSPEKLHVTLYFFGDVDEQKLMNQMVPAVEAAIKSEPPLDLSCVGIGVFPDWKYPKVIWAGISGDTDRLLLMHEQVVDNLKPFDLKRDKRLFRPHLTIGRADKIRKDAHVVQLVEHLGPIEFGHIPVKELTLFRSELTNDGPIYTPLKVLPLG
ncbi:MAG: RNA 2',3'-cyclic phosphodiesterase [Deltaproteobacteria bacterium CG11_big_fil_rev_8_21_14_0_20_47_16]|nr:MAG: RNA 2',3'-cyclic phosphodiesterase [Deltaproteobacteria bacterium CG11_big_fil_rev_8_21_14_0_20_47_16]